MRRYYINRNGQSNGYHEIHVIGCSFFPTLANAVQLGEFSSCEEAKKEAKRRFPTIKVDGCAICLPECHTS